MKKIESNPMYDAWRKIRGDWGEVKPVTRVIPNKKKNTKEKHKEKRYDYE